MAGARRSELFEVAPGAEEEHAAVPVVVARGDEIPGHRGARLLDEARDAIDLAARRTPLDVPIPGLRDRRHYAEGDELSLLRGAEGGMHRLVESRNVPNHVVGRKHEQQRIAGRLRGRRFEGRVGRQSDGRRRIAARGLEHDRLWLDAQLAQLLRHEKTVRLVTDHHRGRRRQALEPQRGLLDHGAFARERQKLLRVKLARERPQARAGAAGENDWGEHGSYRFRFAARPTARARSHGRSDRSGRPSPDRRDCGRRR